MKEKPLVSVVLPAYNSSLYLPEAIESILEQTYKNFEFIIVNDGSKDETEDVILSFNDPRIKYIKNESNLGLVATLNKGLDCSTGKYIVRMDADDISIFNRIEKQVEFMESNTSIAVAGCWYYAFNLNDGRMVKGQTNPETLKSILLFNTCLCHPAVIIRKSVLDLYKFRYNPEFKHLEDYELWIRISKVAKLSNIKEFLFRYRSHEAQVSQLHFTFQKEKANQLRASYLNDLGFKCTADQLYIHNLIAGNVRFSSMEELLAVDNWLQNLVEQNSISKFIEQQAFRQVIGKMWLDSCGNTSLKWKAFFAFFNSPLKKYADTSMKSKTILLAKCWIRRKRKE